MLALDSMMQPCRKIREVEAWLKTFDQLKVRYRFLVLEGLSKVGKTLFCQGLALRRKVSLLEIDRAGADTPDTSGYTFGEHRMVLCDEARAEMVLTYKKLFQASASFTRLGSCKTDCHAYSVWAHRVMFMVTSNRWYMELGKLPSEDSDWLWQNSELVDAPIR